MPDFTAASAFYLEFDCASDHATGLDCAFVLRDQGKFSRISQTEFTSHLTTIRFIYDHHSNTAYPKITVTPPGTLPRRRTTPSDGWVFGVKFHCRIDETLLRTNPDRWACLSRRHLALMSTDMSWNEFEAEFHSATRLLCDLLCLEPSGAAKLKEMDKERSVSSRTERRHFEAMTGLSPKRHYTLSRFHNALVKLARNDRSLSDIAYDCDYSDQPHFSRDFRKMSGQTPRQFFDCWKAHSVHFVQDHEPGSTIRLSISVD